jgi:molecular chaperone GrpE
MPDTPEIDSTPLSEENPSAADALVNDRPEAEAAEPEPASLEDMLKAAELKAAENHDAWLRAKAEGENIRRRAQEDISKASKFAVERFADALLPVRDSLEAALLNENQSAEALKAGVELTLKQLTSAFEKSNLLEIAPVGEKFDPHKHQAISQLDAPDGSEPNTVLTVLQKGYALHDRVVRPALVVVSKAKA